MHVVLDDDAFGGAFVDDGLAGDAQLFRKGVDSHLVGLRLSQCTPLVCRSHRRPIHPPLYVVSMTRRASSPVAGADSGAGSPAGAADSPGSGARVSSLAAASNSGTLALRTSGPTPSAFRAAAAAFS